MYPTIHMALLSAFRFRGSLPRYSAALLDGDFARAYCAVDDAADLSAHSPVRTRDHGHEELTALADVSLLLDNHEEAEEFYRRAQKLIWKNDRALRIASCRNTGWLSLMRSRPGVAERSFARIVAEAELDAEQRIEAYIGIALARHQLAFQAGADDALIAAAELADTHTEPRLRFVVDLLAQEFDVRLKVRAARALNDHAFWQSALASASLGASARNRVEPAQAIGHRPTLLVRRMEELQCLDRLAGGDRTWSAQTLCARAKQSTGGPLAFFHANLEMALAALAGGLADLAGELVERMPVGHADEARRNFDYLYCMAKVNVHRGNPADALRFYSNYTTEALRCLRSETATQPAASGPRKRADTASDDVSARLPPKYRRAYRYILENIDRPDLTTREVAAELNVTMRTIQLVFKRALGVTPCGLIRALRLEGIRGDLLQESGPLNSIFDTASRWGLTSRSTLAKSYRKHFDESPSETIVAHAR
ncbi:helix-turn-helix transcriptional regulator [Trinickia caryophylli]|uniref:Transcriptional regulator, AraC family n=1 Tax=Trinickia caryophylli TaxID=28094 RepID=A0A1X7D5V8_TRICW|nr:helix-turn-helix transcriptional regulator [Trinickia caryophylli]PMS12694.1 AraC family transcriptional regulator [Trinickia caryophylli]TRX15100.1 helix-turn-helix transcriptional regulator [Trinickia caryophylli]WQE14958.1 helix-turn-helix transcriptional regulator [Trinickia caryophylli]SMF09489.1 transcriptional regulator, AraC family [Trinickia caryophylli]GLU31312.1 AraC family transcriptional regulator [Trinickia caryophylli]